MNTTSFEVVEKVAVLLLAIAGLWLVVSFFVQLVAEINGRLVTRGWVPRFVRIAAVFLGGLLLSARTVGGQTDEIADGVNSEGNSQSGFDSMVDVTLIGSVATNVALGSFLLAKRRNELRKVAFSGTSGVDLTVDVAPRHDRVPDWRVLVRVLGPPCVETRDGRTVTFSKGKSLELLVWMTEHRSSSLRSAARTALWDGNVQDATFANVVSDIRRGLNSVVGEPEDEEWIPRTFSDRLPLHAEVVTDAQLLEIEIDRYERGDKVRGHQALAEALERAVHLPFFGVNYGWADAEGITTSHVILVVRAAVALAELSILQGDTALLFASTERGLRVLPGHEELVLLRMRGHAQLGNRAAIKMEWEAYARAVEADAWAGGEPSEVLREAAEELSKV
jgi:hypothetical protein